MNTPTDTGMPHVKNIRHKEYPTCQLLNSNGKVIKSIGATHCTRFKELTYEPPIGNSPTQEELPVLTTCNNLSEDSVYCTLNEGMPCPIQGMRGKVRNTIVNVTVEYLR